MRFFRRYENKKTYFFFFSSPFSSISTYKTRVRTRTGNVLITTGSITGVNPAFPRSVVVIGYFVASLFAACVRPPGIITITIITYKQMGTGCFLCVCVFFFLLYIYTRTGEV